MTENKLQFIHIKQINPTNVSEVYQKQFNSFLFDYSDEVDIDGKTYGNKANDKFKRMLLGYLPNEKGEPNFKKIITNDIKDGFTLTEIDFIEHEQEIMVNYTPKNITEKKQEKLYNEFLKNRLSGLTTPKEAINHFDSSRPLKNYELFYNHYKCFFVNIAHNNIEHFLDTCSMFEKEGLTDISYRAKQEIEQLLNSQNNNAERLIKRLQREKTELKELHVKAYKEHKINNAQTLNVNNLLSTFHSATFGFGLFYDSIAPLIDEPHTSKDNHQPIVESPFSVLEWATIFYYADETKLLPENRMITTRMEQFMNKHKLKTTPKNFKAKYYEAKKRINTKNDYPINKLELILPFLKENYKQTVTKVENEITFLEENKPEY